MDEVGGLARMATLVRRIREENREKNVRTLLLVAGDILLGTPMSTVFKGEPDILCLNAMAVGNHEFNFGSDHWSLTTSLPQGGDGYAVFKDKSHIRTGSPLRELIIDTVRRRKLISAKTGGRIRRLE